MTWLLVFGAFFTGLAVGAAITTLLGPMPGYCARCGSLCEPNDEGGDENG